MSKTPRPDLQSFLNLEKKKGKGTYRSKEIIDQLEIDCLNKCYICEDSEATTLNVEHLIPHQGDIELQFCWENLLWSCGHCNGTKLNKFHPILDCSKDPQIWEQVQLYVSRYPKFEVRVVGKPTPGNEDACLKTVELLEQCFTGKTPIRKSEAKNLLNRMLKADVALSDAILNNDDSQIVQLVSSQASFAGMLRWNLCLEHSSIWGRIRTQVA